jgi:hypothetical protein
VSPALILDGIKRWRNKRDSVQLQVQSRVSEESRVSELSSVGSEDLLMSHMHPELRQRALFYSAMRDASMWETEHIWESGYIVGEVAIGAVLGFFLRNPGAYYSTLRALKLQRADEAKMGPGH